MKQDPIKFRMVFDWQSAFKPYHDRQGNYIEARHVVVIPFPWNHGSAIKFEIEEYYVTKTFERKISVLDYVIYYDSKNPQYKDTMDALCSGMVNGKIAENMAHSLYWNLFLNSDICKKHLPEIRKDLENLKIDLSKIGVGNSPNRG